MIETNRIYQGDALATLRSWPDAFVQTVVTSPPYWGLRDYGVEGQMGLENTPGQYVAAMVELFREVRRVLKNDGTLWLNIGDSYIGSWGAASNDINGAAKRIGSTERHPTSRKIDGLKPKDLAGVPWRLAMALQSDGWYLRSDIIWSKPNPMPESVTDRPTRAHEYIFLLSKSERYYYDQEAIKEKAIYADIKGMDSTGSKDGAMFDGKQGRRAHKIERQRGHGRRHDGFSDRWDAMGRKEQCSGLRNKRSVWEVSPATFEESHFATFPEALIQPCILAGCPTGGVVLDPFMGAGTTALVSAKLKRHFIGVELNPAYVAMAEKRIAPELAQEKFL